MPGHDIVVIGASAGGIAALQRLFKRLPAAFPAAICVVQHISASSPGLLGQILGKDCQLPSCLAEDLMPLALGAIHVAPPDRHLLVERGRLRVSRGPKENLHRPSIDPLFRSAAAAYGSRVVGVVLTGLLDDGTSGLQAIKSAGGVTMVQDPEEAQFRSMPDSALANVRIDHCLPMDGLADALIALVGEPDRPELVPERDSLVREAAMALGGHTEPGELDRMGRLSSFTCPECHGALWELDDEAMLRFRCHIGHAFTVDSLHQAQTDQEERALGVALRTLEEQATLFARMGVRAQQHGQGRLTDRFRRRSGEYRKDAEILRAMLQRGPPRRPGEDEVGLGPAGHES